MIRNGGTGDGAAGGPGERPSQSSGPFGLEARNFALLAAGLAAIAGGYVLLGEGSTVAAPLLLVLGYAVCVPAGLLVGLRVRDGRGDARGE